jgi:hypothetical protein
MFVCVCVCVCGEKTESTQPRIDALLVFVASVKVELQLTVECCVVRRDDTRLGGMRFEQAVARLHEQLEWNTVEPFVNEQESNEALLGTLTIDGDVSVSGH